MSKSIKRTLSLLLALTMVLSLGLPAYAVGAPAEDEVVISEEPIALPEQEPVEEPVEKPSTLPIGAGKIPGIVEEDEIISEDLIVDIADEELVVEEEAAPAKDFVYSESATGFTVEVSAPAGALPLGTEMFVDRLIDLSAVQAAVDNTEDLTGSVRVAADISFWLNGKEIEPAEGAKLVVRMSAPEIEAIAEPVVIHIPDGENAVPEIVEQLNSGDIAMADTVSFEAASFSIYAIVSDDVVVTPRTTYHFLSEVQADGTAQPFYFVNKAGDSVDYQIMKGEEKLEDPGHPVTSLEKNFLGWFIVEKNGDTYTFPTGGQKIDFSQPHPVPSTIDSGDQDVYVAARFGQAFIVTFWDNAKGSPADQLHIVAKKVVYLDEGKTYAEVRVDDVTAPSAATHVHNAWTSDDYKAGEQTTYTLLEKPVWDEVSNSFNLYPIFSAGHWLRFSGGPAGSGAGYRSAIFVTANTTASELASLGTVDREGYTFTGWYYDGYEGSEPATDANGAALDAADLLDRVQNAEGDTVLYGNWTGNSVTYRVATWFENANDDNYTFGEVTNRTGTAGTTTNVTASAVSGFTAQTVTQQEIKGDGTTIVNVYYKRNIYEIKFYRANVQTSWNGNYTVSAGTQYTNLTISAKYEQDIHTEWPSFKGYGAPWYVGTGQNVAWVLMVPTMPLNGGSYYEYTGSGSNLNQIFWIQSVNGGNSFDSMFETPYNGSNTISSTADDYIHIEGFRVNAYNANNAQAIRNNPSGDPDAVSDSNYNRSIAIGTSYRNGRRVGNTYILDYYYLRNQYNVSFNLQKSGVDAEGTAMTAPAALTNIYYQANIASAKATQIAALNAQFVKGETSITVTGEGDYIFQGWYQNAACLGDEFNFDQEMPAGNITLYAKWERVYYLIQIDPNGGEIKPNVDEVTYTWLQYGDKIERYNIRRDYVEAPADYTGTKYYYYEVLASEDPLRHAEKGYYYKDLRKGFYYDSSLYQNRSAFMNAYGIYNSEYADSNWTIISGKGMDSTTAYMPATTNDNYAFVGWYKATINADDTLTYTNEVYDFDEEITGDTAIYAKWRRSGLFSVQYHTMNGTVSGLIGGSLVATDSSYADQATTQIAYTPVSITSKDGKTYVFKGWQPVDPDGFDAEDPGSATPLGSKLYVQGDDFLVEADNADSGHYIHLVAQYELAESNPDTLPVTTVSFNPNFPAGATNTSGEAKTVEGVPLNTAIDLSKTSFTIVTEDGDRVETIPQFSCFGYTQIGWNTQPDGSGQGFKMTDIVGVDDLDRTSTNTKANVLYAIWGPAYFYVYQSSNNKVTRVSMEGYTAETTYDLTALVDKTAVLYGGYYRDYAGKTDGFVAEKLTYTDNVATDTGATSYDGKNVTWVKAEAYKIGDEDFAGPGTAIKPVADEVYYIKEVSADEFLQQRLKYTYRTVGGRMGAAWVLTNADDDNYEAVGFTIGSTDNVGSLTDTFTIRLMNVNDPPKTFTVSGDNALFTKGAKMAFKEVYWDRAAFAEGITPFGENKNLLTGAVRNYWITLDGLKVTNYVSRTYSDVGWAYKIKAVDDKTSFKVEIIENSATPSI